MAAVSRHLVLTDFLRSHEWQAVVLPLVEATAHGIDIGVTEVLKGFGSERRPDTSGAVDDNRLIPVRQCLVSLDFQEPARQEYGFVQMALLPFISFTHIEQSEAI